MVTSLVLLMAFGARETAHGAFQPQAPRSPGPTELLEKVWPGYPEWLAMLAEILAGNAPAPDAGWYRKAVSQTRFDWKTVSGRFDRNHDGAIARDEFPGPDADFQRLDRDRDGRLTATDLDFSANRGGESFGLEAFSTADRDGDGKLSRQEFTAFNKAMGGDPVFRMIRAKPREELEARLAAYERDGSGFLALSDFQDAFNLSGRQNPPASSPIQRQAPAHVSKEILFRGFLRRELGAFGPGPALEAPAPDFTLEAPNGSQAINLSQLVGSKPVVLIFGNFTCRPFRSHAGSLERLYERYKDRARFVVVYTREAHPADGWQLDDNRREGIVFKQPRDLAERSSLALTCRKALGLGMPMLVDSMDDRVGTLYSGMPSRLYLIDGAGKITYKGGRFPFGFKPAELEQALILLLQADSSSKPPS
jgi:thiol-disulfide isomerase/thioredoxin